MSSTERTALFLASLGMFVSTLDTGIVNIALPTLASQFHASISGVSGVVTSYALALSASILIFGALADRFGRARIIGIGFAVFGIFSIGCAMAASVFQLDAFRAAAGIGAAMLQATSAALVAQYVAPQRRAAAFGTMSAFLALGPVLGPSVGGFIVTFTTWRWIFWINTPLCIAGMLAAFSLARVVVAPASASDARDAGKPTSRTMPFVACAALGGAFIAVFVATPFLLERTVHLQPWQTGLVLLVAPLSALCGAKLSGHLMHRVAKTTLIVAGLLVMSVSAAAFLALNPSRALALFAATLAVWGLGSGIMQTPAIAAGVETFPPHQQARAGAAFRFVQNLAIGGGAAATAALLQHVGIAAVWVFATVVPAVALVYAATQQLDGLATLFQRT